MGNNCAGGGFVRGVPPQNGQEEVRVLIREYGGAKYIYCDDGQLKFCTLQQPNDYPWTITQYSENTFTLSVRVDGNEHFLSLGSRRSRRSRRVKLSNTKKQWKWVLHALAGKKTLKPCEPLTGYLSIDNNRFQLDSKLANAQWIEIEDVE